MSIFGKLVPYFAAPAVLEGLENLFNILLHKALSLLPRHTVLELFYFFPMTFNMMTIADTVPFSPIYFRTLGVFLRTPNMLEAFIRKVYTRLYLTRTIRGACGANGYE